MSTSQITVSVFTTVYSMVNITVFSSLQFFSYSCSLFRIYVHFIAYNRLTTANLVQKVNTVTMASSCTVNIPESVLTVMICSGKRKGTKGSVLCKLQEDWRKPCYLLALPQFSDWLYFLIRWAGLRNACKYPWYG